ncbi:hypothetical protein Sjap_009329 [Stephania japonica]|uniref:SRP54-type proteins GTP-binding domain-containing protein n=1 Tax=Stephania japonica TaxID=461633 RepID=A0AAP0JTH2_9MAGN
MVLESPPILLRLLIGYSSVMMAAYAIFRSGAVKQLKTHARRLQINLFEKGYEKDPAIVAKEAIQEATRSGKDVVLVDTAGLMQARERPLLEAHWLGTLRR